MDRFQRPVASAVVAAFAYVSLRRLLRPRSPPIPRELTEDSKISIIIPAKNEAAVVCTQLKLLEKHCTSPQGLEVIFVDAQSQDGSVEAVKALRLGIPVKVTTSANGRAAAQNEGVARSSGDILLFLHADTKLPRGFDTMIRQCLLKPRVLAGAFRFGVDPESYTRPTPPRGIGFISWVANLRAKYLQLPYGDQALFLSRKVFDGVGGFPDVLMMEDYMLVKRLQQQGAKEGGYIDILPATALCSGRRWEKHGVLKVTLLNQWFVFAYTVLGFSDRTIFNWYYGVPSKPK